MYTNISNEAKEILKSNSIITAAKLVFPDIVDGNNNFLIIDESLLLDVCKITDFCYKDGQIIGTAMSKEVELYVDTSEFEYNLKDQEFELYGKVMLSSGEYEEVPLGKYIITSYEDTKSNNKFKIIAYDFMTKLNGEFSENKIFNPTFPITLKNFYIQFMQSYGIQIEIQTLPNENFIITEMPNFDGMTGRTILGHISSLFAGFAKINRNGNCQIYLQTNTDEQIDDNIMNTSLVINDKYGPVNTIVVGISNIEGENVTLKDETSIATNGETTIAIFDNPFTYTEELREQVIQDLYDALNGFEYYPTEFKGKALFYLDNADRIQVLDVKTSQYVSTIILNQTINIPKTRSSKYSNLALTNTEVKNQYISKSKQAKTKTEIMVDKQNQIIKSIVSITQNLDGNINILSADMQKKLTDLGVAFAEYQETISTQFTQTATDYTFLFNHLLESINNNKDETDSSFVEISKYIRFEDGDIILGQNDSSLKLEIQHDRIAYVQNNTEVAYFSNNKLYIREAEIIERLYLGNFAFTPRSNGSLSFGKVRG